VIHKDIHPGNILYNPENGAVRIIDFSIASVLSLENPQLQPPEHLEGTLSYISPEQTGRMNRLLDFRTDYYSLGATLYELLVGQPPFTTTDPLELVHCHIAKQPVACHELNPEIPEVVSAIVLKLLSKNAERRYRSALGIKADLEECLRQLRRTKDIQGFALGRKDLSDRLMIPQKLYGRKDEIEALLAGFARVCQGKKELMLVAGPSGIGKTSLVQEVHRPMTSKQAFFLFSSPRSCERSRPRACCGSSLAPAAGTGFWNGSKGSRSPTTWPRSWRPRSRSSTTRPSWL